MTVPIPIAEVKALGQRHGCQALVAWYVLPDGRYGWTSWGRTRHECQALRRISPISDEIGERYTAELDR